MTPIRPPDRPTDTTLALYLAGQAPLAECAAVERWAESNPTHARELATLCAAWQDRPAASDVSPSTTARAEWSRLAWRINGNSSPTAHPTGTPRRQWPRRVAAFVVGALAAASLILLITMVRSRSAGSVRWREYATLSGGREIITLGDGTRITLAPASRVRVPTAYEAGDHTVALTGEAFFSVMHDARHAFTVRARNAVTHDIGTAFDVRAYAGDTVVRVAVVEGQVLVGTLQGRRTQSPVSLTAGEASLIDARDHVSVPQQVDVKTLASWTQGRLVFRDALLSDVVADLARWSGTDIRVADPGLARRRVSAAYSGEPIASVLALLAPVVGARVDYVDGTYALTPLSPLPTRKGIP